MNEHEHGHVARRPDGYAGHDPRPLFRDEAPATDEVPDGPTVVLRAGAPADGASGARRFPPTARRGADAEPTSVLAIDELPDATAFQPAAAAPRAKAAPAALLDADRGQRDAQAPAPDPEVAPPAPAAPRARPPRDRRLRVPGGWRGRLALALALFLLVPTGLYLLMDTRLGRVDAFPSGARPAATPGADWLIVGSDSREGLSSAERRKLKTGTAQGRRTDMMMLLHIPESGGGPTLVSLPRDSYVPIPGYGRNRLNAAYAFGGAPLLIRTVENATRIRIDHYAEIGFAGVFDMVNAVGGVEMCVKQAIKDDKAGLNIKKGCQNLEGQEALGYARSRDSMRGDLDRVNHQRELMTALMSKAASPGTLVNPFRVLPLVSSATGALKVDGGDHLYDLARLGFAAKSLGSDGTMTTVPIGRAFTASGVGAVLTWEPTLAERLWTALRTDKQVPKAVVRS